MRHESLTERPASSRGRKPHRALAVVNALLLALLTACGGDHTPAPTADAVVQAQPPSETTAEPTGPRSLGVAEIELTEGSDGQVNSTLSWVQPEGVRKALAARATGGEASTQAALTEMPNYMDTAIVSTGVKSVGVAGAGGMRYFWFNLKVRNARSCVNKGSCQANTQARTNLTFMGAQFSTSVNGTAFTRFETASGAPATALALQTIPTHGMNAAGTEVDTARASLQVYRESELADVTPDPDGVVNVLPYGFVVTNVNNGSRTLPANPAVNQYDGVVTIAFAHPLQANTADHPTRISVRLQLVRDADTRVTQSLQEASFAGDAAATARAATQNATEVATLCTRLAQVPNGVPVCGVRTAGSAASPGATMGTSVATPQVLAAPSNLINRPLNGEVVLGTSTEMTTPTAATLVVHGSMSGLRTLTGAYAGSYDGGSGSTSRKNQLVFKLGAGDKPFFRGETVSFTATSGNTSASGGALQAFTGQFVTQGSMAGSSGLLATQEAEAVLGRFPQATALGDLNGDGELDAVVANTTSDNVSILLGNGAGGFSPALVPTVAAGDGPSDVALGDLNGDGKLDAVVASRNSDGISILIGDGAGGFTPAATPFVATAVGPISIALGDLNGDGKLDAVVANIVSSKVSILIGDGAGGFGPAENVAAGDRPVSIALGDLNGDGKLDAVTTNNGGDDVSILIGNGAGRFATAVNVAVGNGPVSIVLGDLNSDGKLDAMVANQHSDNVSILIGDGAGGFATAVHVAAGDGPVSIALGDLNGDGKLDAVVTNFISDSVSILIGNGAGGFDPAVNVAGGDAPISIALGDLNGDGKLDAVVANNLGSGTLTPLLGQ